MKILILGNCVTYQSFKYMPLILNEIENNIELTICYNSAAGLSTYVKHFETNLQQPITKEKRARAKSPNVIYNYVKGENKLKEERMPNTNVKKIIELKKWDKIVLSIINPDYDIIFNYSDCFNKLKNLYEKIRAISSAKLYLIYPPSSTQTFRNFSIYNLIIKQDKKTNEINNIDQEKINDLILNNFCKKLKIEKINFLPIYKKINKSSIGNKFGLLLDGIHYDPYIGYYILSCIMYYNLFYEELKIKISKIKDILITYTPKKYLDNYKKGNEIDCYCVPVNKENRQIIEKIIEKNFIIK